jgi:ABC-2 type transport system permease protein
VALIDPAGVLGITSETVLAPRAVTDEVEEALRSVGGGGVRGVPDVKAVAGVKLLPFAGREEALAALGRAEVASVLELGEDFIATGEADLFIQQKDQLLFLTSSRGLRSLVQEHIRDRLLADRVEQEVAARVRSPMKLSTVLVQPDGSVRPASARELISALAVPLFFAMLFFISVMMCSGLLLHGVAEEKENRVIEVLLSSIDATRLLFGKLLGLGTAGLIQVIVWSAMVALPSSILVVAAAPRISAILASIVFYALGFLLYGILLTATGALGQTSRESQQYGMVWSLFSVIPVVLFMIILGEPNGALARALSFFPLTAPVTMFLRLHASNPPPWWEVLAVMAVLALGCYAALRIMARMFRVGLLLYGKRPSIRDVVGLLFGRG